MRNKILVIGLGVVVFLLSASVIFAEIYKDPNYSVEERVEDLLSRMTLDEKIGQMIQADRGSVQTSDITNYFLGSLLSGGGSAPNPNTPEGWANMYDTFQNGALATRLGIPIVYGMDAVHGHNNIYGATIFPHNIGLGAARDPNLIEEIGKVTAKEVAATGMDWTFAPCVAVARDERWGRFYESFGEDPELQNLLTERYIKGFQGLTMSGENIISCAKHYVGDGGTTFGTGDNNYLIDRGDTQVDEATLRAIHLPGYIQAINADVGTVMVSFSSWNGLKMHAHEYLVTDVLKNELGFNGFVISDWNGIDEIGEPYSYCVRTSVNAGIDMFMIPSDWKRFIGILKEEVNWNNVSMSRIDDAVRRILRVKFKAGLFEYPYADRSQNDGSFGSIEHRAVARKAVRKSLALLKNENNILPFSKDSRIFVAGKNADNIGNQCGGWTISWQGSSGYITPGTTILGGIQNAVWAGGGSVTYDLAGNGAAGHDLAIVVIGETPYAEGVGDRDYLGLDSTDINCLNSVYAAGIPVVVVIVSGRPLIVTDQIQNWDAFIAAWLPGTEGDGVADVLFGDYDFMGKLSCTWPVNMDSIPTNIGDADYNPLFAYGYGLKYNSESATASSSKDTNTPRNAIDGSLATRWESEWSDPQWLCIDFGSSKDINKVTINWEAAYGKSYKIQISNDGYNWTDVYSTTNGDGTEDIITFNRVSARYLRLYGTERGTQWGYSIWEMKVENNLALGKNTTASSGDGGTAVDGDYSTRWSSDASDPQWLTVDLGSMEIINKIVLNWEAAYGKAYKIQVSAYETNWTDIYLTSNSDGGIDEVSFGATDARYVRMYGIERGTTWGYSLWEMEIYYIPDPSPPTQGEITGNVNLQDRSYQSALIAFELRNPGQTTALQTYQINTNTEGNYNLDNVPVGTYDLTAKASNYLRAKQANIIVNADQVTPNINFSLLGGDANGDNKVNYEDRRILKEAYGSVEGSLRWDERADFNADNKVNYEDRNILNKNYGQIGD